VTIGVLHEDQLPPIASRPHVVNTRLEVVA